METIFVLWAYDSMLCHEFVVYIHIFTQSVQQVLADFVPIHV